MTAWTDPSGADKAAAAAVTVGAAPVIVAAEAVAAPASASAKDIHQRRSPLLEQYKKNLPVTNQTSQTAKGTGINHITCGER